MSEAFRCDKCGQLIPGAPKKVSREVTVGKRTLEFRLVDARATFNMTFDTVIPDLCKDCFIGLLKEVAEVKVVEKET